MNQKKANRAPPMLAAAARVKRPNKAQAAHYLRYLAELLELEDWRPPAMDDARRKRLQLELHTIADCIENNSWVKGSETLTMKQQDDIRAVARWEPAKGVSLTDLLTETAQTLANQWGWRGQDDWERVRGMIVEARKKLSRERRGK